MPRKCVPVYDCSFIWFQSREASLGSADTIPVEMCTDEDDPVSRHVHAGGLTACCYLVACHITL